jgi:hypothetical protein
MELKQRIAAFVQLGKFLSSFEKDAPWPGYDLGITASEYDVFNGLVKTVHLYNGWFTEENVRKSLFEWGNALSEANLEKWLSAYALPERSSPKTVALILAGNIPLVGFHDVLAVLISGNKVLIKLSSDDDRLIPAVLEVLIKDIQPEFASYIQFASGKLEAFDAVIATGSDNSARYFESYFGKYPHIIRSNRTSVAVLTGDESQEELKALGHDIFDYFGLGCRNVSKMFVPADFDLDRFFGAVFPFHSIIQHKKYANNYDYHKAIMLMNRDQLLENGFMLLKEDEQLHSPLGVLYYERYESAMDLDSKLQKLGNKLQVVVGKNYVPFGKSQSPALWDYADGVDTLQFIQNL